MDFSGIVPGLLVFEGFEKTPLDEEWELAEKLFP